MYKIRNRMKGCSYSKTILLTSVPMPPLCHTVKTSPFLRSLLGFENHPIPDGVPIRTMEPARIVVPDDRDASVLLTVNIISLCIQMRKRSSI